MSFALAMVLKVTLFHIVKSKASCAAVSSCVHTLSAVQLILFARVCTVMSQLFSVHGKQVIFLFVIAL